MPSPRSRPRPVRPSSPTEADRPAARRLAGRLTALALLPLAAACATPGPVPPPPAEVERREAVPAELRPYLIPPRAGWPEAVAEPARERLAEGFDALEEGDLAAARAAADELLAADPLFAPATVLAAQADLVAGEPGAALERLGPVADGRPGYVAAQLAFGRAAEAAGALVRAFAAFTAVAAAAPDEHPVAAERLAALRPRVVEVLGRRVDDALARGELDRAGEALRSLEAWAPDETVTLRSAIVVARARDDRRAELAAIRRLAPRTPEDRELAERRGELELEVGDPGAGLQAFEGLARRYPGDAALAERLAYAKFRWRVAQLPPKVVEAAEAAELDRGGFATLLYWLVPQVRYGRGGTARIASDVLDDPRREEMVRVINLGLIPIDRSLHRFYPDRPVTLGGALEALHRVLERQGRAGCSGDGAAAGSCAAAAACGLIRAAEECPRAETISGAAAVELIRRTLGRLGDG